jgi:hypothetical protein
MKTKKVPMRKKGKRTTATLTTTEWQGNKSSCKIRMYVQRNHHVQGKDGDNNT